EEGPSEQVFSAPQHTYTKALLSAVPKLGAMEGTDLPARFPLLQVEGQVQPVAEPGITSTQEVPAAKREPILSVRNLVTRFDLRGGILSR
ncbi:glutathione ABC transporter ATP-binding protein GsiA, partial [Escherichia coli]|nr:glutathione ABC transporter ATP-binding protein GsiA [Escherichia coli]